MVLESSNLVNNEKEEGSKKRSITLWRLKLVQHCIQLTIAKNEKFSKAAVTFLVYDRMFVNSYCCCDRKALAARAQSFALWQQATIEIMHHDHSIIACLRHLYMGVVLHAHSVCGELCIQCNASGEVATTSPPFYNEPHQSHVLFVKAAPGTTFTS